MNTGIIYMYTAPNGKSYVGQTWDEQKRRWDHRSPSRKKSVFHTAIKKYGKDSFVYEILHSNIETQEELNRLESETIARFNTIAPHGYNLTTGGEGGKHHEVSKQKMRDIWVLKKDEKVASFKQAASRPEVRARLKQNGINNASNPEIMEKKSQSLKLAFASQEVRFERSEKRKQEWANPKIRAKRLENQIKARSTEKYKLRQIEIMKKRWESAEYRLEMKKKLTGKVMPRSGVDSAAKKRMVKVQCIESGQIFDSIKDAAKFYQITHSNISAVLSGKQKKAAGKTWKKLQNDNATS
jgi:group I intron endonuclease